MITILRDILILLVSIVFLLIIFWLLFGNKKFSEEVLCLICKEPQGYLMVILTAALILVISIIVPSNQYVLIARILPAITVYIAAIISLPSACQYWCPKEDGYNQGVKRNNSSN